MTRINKIFHPENPVNPVKSLFGSGLSRLGDTEHHRSGRIYCIGSEEGKKETMSVLAAASGFFRKELARRLRLRRIPEISFQWDDSIERGAHLLELIDGISTDKNR